MTKALAVSEPISLTPATMLDRAVSTGAGIDVIEKLMGLQERWEANQALKAYNNAIAQARAEIPIILKTNEKTGAGGSYKYEDFASIARTIDPILGKHDLSYRYKSDSSNGTLTVTCVITHALGHSEENSLTAQPNKFGSSMNDIQALGSAVTYLQRYTLKLALGIATSKDDDGSGDPWGALLREMSTNKTARELQTWGLENADRIHNTSGVKAHFRKQYAAYLDQLKAAEGGVKEQLKQSIIEHDAAPKFEDTPFYKEQTDKRQPGEPRDNATPYKDMAATTAEIIGDAIPDHPTTIHDPDKYLDELDTLMTACRTDDSLDEVWAEHVMVADGLMEPDQDKAQYLFEKHEARIKATIAAKANPAKKK